jgi:outer membrane protein assembly factor BamA
LGGDNYFGLGVSGDFYIFDLPLVSDIGLGWYLGVGGYVNLSLWNSNSSNSGMGLSLGGRVPIGLSWMLPLPLPLPLELYLQAHVGLGVSVFNPFHFPDFGWGGNLGIRIWL